MSMYVLAPRRVSGDVVLDARELELTVVLLDREPIDPEHDFAAANRSRARLCCGRARAPRSAARRPGP
jgi:hypothetical protein